MRSTEKILPVTWETHKPKLLDQSVRRSGKRPQHQSCFQVGWIHSLFYRMYSDWWTDPKLTYYRTKPENRSWRGWAGVRFWASMTWGAPRRIRMDTVRCDECHWWPEDYVRSPRPTSVLGLSKVVLRLRLPTPLSINPVNGHNGVLKQIQWTATGAAGHNEIRNRTSQKNHPPFLSSCHPASQHTCKRQSCSSC